MLVSGGHSQPARGRRRDRRRRADGRRPSTTRRARRSTRWPGCSGCRSPAVRTSTARPPQRQQRRDRLPARAHQPARPRAAPVRLLVLRAQDRGRPLGRGPASATASRSRGRRRRVVPGGGLRRADPQGDRRRDQPTGIEDLLIGGGVAANSTAARDGRGARCRQSASASGFRGRGSAPTTAPWSPRSAPSSSPRGRTPSLSTCRPTPPAGHHRRRLTSWGQLGTAPGDRSEPTCSMSVVAPRCRPARAGGSL